MAQMALELEKSRDSDLGYNQSAEVNLAQTATSTENVKLRRVAFGLFSLPACYLLFLFSMLGLRNFAPRVPNDLVNNFASWVPDNFLLHGTWPGPTADEDYGSWLQGLQSWAKETRTSSNYSGEPIYSEPRLSWTRSSYIQPQIHVYDRFLFEGKWTVDRYLDDLEARFGGIDSVLLWPTYPNLGIDLRNQFDYYKALPGGLAGLKEVVAAFRRRGVKVLLGYNPWDRATRDKGGWPHPQSLAALLKAVEADGMNGDTMSSVPREFWEAGVASNWPFAVEPEHGGVPAASLRTGWETAGWTPLGWGYAHYARPGWTTDFRYDFVPPVDRTKYLDRKGRHLTHVCGRWVKNRTEQIQLAFFNGQGYVPWENIWGIFNQVVERDAELLRRAALLLRWAGSMGLTQGYDDDSWLPHSPDVKGGRGVFASRFQRGHNMLWLLVNKFAGAHGLGGDVEATVVLPDFGESSPILLDLWHGQELTAIRSDAGWQVRMHVEGLGLGALFLTSERDSTRAVMLEMRALAQRRLDSFSSAWKFLPQQMDPVESAMQAEVPSGMVLIPKANFTFRVSGTEIEGGCDPNDDPNGICCSTECAMKMSMTSCQCGLWSEDFFAVDVQFPWEDRPSRNHERELLLGPFLIDKDLVTNDEYRSYLARSGYAHEGHGSPKANDGKRPVVNIGYEEAKAYCRFQGKRLPHSYEWQYAAQGGDGRLYPWGNRWDPEAVAPEGHDPEEIGLRSRGDSPFGLRDLVGNVWQFTDSFRDEHTRSVLLRGSSRFRPVASSEYPAERQSQNWYFPPALQLTKHSKYFLMADSYERAGTLGFRCAADVAGGAPAPFHYVDLGPRPRPTAEVSV